MKKLLLLTAFYTVTLSFSQTKIKTVHVKYANEPITIDAVLDEPSWSQTEPATNKGVVSSIYNNLILL